MEAIFLLFALLAGYLLLRWRGGEGLDIKFELGPTSTQKGKTNRLVLAVALAIWSAGFAYIIFHERSSTRVPIITSFIVGAVVGLIFLVPFLKNRSRK